MQIKKILKIILDYFLKLENMKLELLVIVYKNVSVNLFLNFVHTARHTMEILFILRFIIIGKKRTKVKS